jgi:hypothetical protein
MNRVGKKAAGRLLDGVEHNGFPEVDRAWNGTSVRMPLTLVDNEDRAGRIPGQPGYMGPGR